MTSEQRRVQDVIARLNGDYRRDGEPAREYLGRIADRAVNRASSMTIVVGEGVYRDYEMELAAWSRFDVNGTGVGFQMLFYRGIRVRSDPDLDSNYAQLKEN